MRSEREVERTVCKYAEGEGLTQYKFNSANARGVPDRLFLYRGMAMFIEFKAEGNTSGWDPLQRKQANVLMEQGVPVFLCSDIVQGKASVDAFIGSTDAKLNFYRVDEVNQE